MKLHLEYTRDVIDQRYCNLYNLIKIGLQCFPEKDHIIEIFINLYHKKRHVQDKLFWDISNPDNSPEEFASMMALEFKLDRTFIPLITM